MIFKNPLASAIISHYKSFIVSCFTFCLLPFSFLLLPFSFLLSPFSFLLSPFSFLLNWHLSQGQAQHQLFSS
ncbi:MAG: hypothetical protein EPN88_06180 [Bacteroidetes bacterium]|nr:MAG: hypothetical protein EPN88_06180 [Bacteroidota bacterium]